MNYIDAINYIMMSRTFSKKAGLHRIKELLSYMGNPHKDLKFIHIAGTNGKGSTTSFISNILIEAGYKVGTYTSPHIMKFTERIKVNNNEIPEEYIAEITSQIKLKIDELDEGNNNIPTVFDIITAIAFKYFFDMKCEIVVLETGLGGTYDSTNIIKSNEASVITAIGHEHTDILGKDINSIALHKAGIIKENSDVIVYPQEKYIMDIFEKVSYEKKSRFNPVLQENIIKKDNNKNLTSTEFSYKNLNNLSISLLGSHQIVNASVSIETIFALKQKGYRITDDNIKCGLSKTRWPARFELLCTSPTFIIDGAHNPQSALTLVESIKEYFVDKKITFITGVLSDKDYKATLQPVIHMANKFITLTPNSSRALSGKCLADYLAKYHNNVTYAKDISTALQHCLEEKDEIICAFGSLYLVSEIRAIITSKF